MQLHCATPDKSRDIFQMKQESAACYSGESSINRLHFSCVPSLESFKTMKKDDGTSVTISSIKTSDVSLNTMQQVQKLSLEPHCHRTVDAGEEAAVEGPGIENHGGWPSSVPPSGHQEDIGTLLCRNQQFTNIPWECSPQTESRTKKYASVLKRVKGHRFLNAWPF